ncbi:unnamed protein product [Allacma fusca]|uniref:Uncharacterized protein n=1 Tax=Allacma fusca TaxID=39272 RepID=A0A8J2KC55_9HEXA|nr:unnamed protein product [Allacma fusca]
MVESPSYVSIVDCCASIDSLQLLLISHSTLSYESVLIAAIIMAFEAEASFIRRALGETHFCDGKVHKCMRDHHPHWNSDACWKHYKLGIVNRYKAPELIAGQSSLLKV